MYSNCKFINFVCTKSVSVAIGKKRQYTFAYVGCRRVTNAWVDGELIVVKTSWTSRNEF